MVALVVVLVLLLVVVLVLVLVVVVVLVEGTYLAARKLHHELIIADHTSSKPINYQPFKKLDFESLKCDRCVGRANLAFVDLSSILNKPEL